jgi:2-iminoacetate synthase
MDQAKPGLIKLFCHPNGLTTLKEYLVDYADADTTSAGNDLIEKEISKIDNENIREITRKNLIDIEQGLRDAYL